MPNENKLSHGSGKRKWRQTLAQGALATKAARKKAIVAVARQLAVDLWRIRTGRVEAKALGLS